ncbi:glycosyltransferase family 2 protein [Methylicorpusculum sp.]|nr:glycosyltransferase family 2 protein [Methylicorpusculum sp.]MDP2178683.1 glycosyltransferase family 2 protein [Methylicorpusculum sp.]MDP3529568.1 glycosyltransferase family 2 protein [Methylicorpusculum sp.]
MEKYTVIIPTRDRAETLESTIRTCLRQTYENFEIIVSDNFSNDNTKEIVEKFHDPRIRYINPGYRLSMSGNFEFALGHVQDGFVMFIGSDDGIMPDAIKYVDSIVKKYKVDAVSCQQATYVWPNFPDKTIAGRLVFGGIRNDIEIRSSNEWISKVLSFESFYCFDLPNLYCGFVHKRIIDKAYQDGRYFRSITPDAYSAFATAIFVENYAFSFRPFSIAGASMKSNGASSLHQSGDGKESNKFYAENDIDFHEEFVSCPSFEFSCAEAFAQLAKVFPERCTAYKIDYKKMLQNAVKNSNERTVDEVKSAVEIMASRFLVDINSDSGINIRFDLVRKLKNLFYVMSDPLGAIGIKSSYLCGINDINDAALASHLLMSRRGSPIFVRKMIFISSYFNKLIRLLGLRKIT